MVKNQFHLVIRTLIGSRNTLTRGIPIVLLALLLTTVPGLSQVIGRNSSSQFSTTHGSTSNLSALFAPPQVPIPNVNLTGLGSVDIGTNFSFTVSFQNNDPSDVGYGPVIDLVFPVNGVDGLANSDTADGVDFIDATYLGIPVTSFELVFPDADGGGPGTTGCVDHPLFMDEFGSPFQVCGTAGDKLVVLELPFGSFAPNQPEAFITVNATQGDAGRTPPLVAGYADLNQALPIRARGGFRFASDPLDNPCCDHVADTLIPTTSDSSAWPESGTVTPTLLTLTKMYSGTDNETTTGPNFPRRYTLALDIATGQNVTNVQIGDILPNNMQFESLISTNPGATCSLPSTSTPGGILSCDFSAAGMISGSAEVIFQYHIPRLNSTGGAVVPPSTGAAQSSLNNASAAADWDPTDPRDSPQSFTIDVSGPEHTLADRSIAIQKSVANISGTLEDVSPGDTLEYTLDFQVSDFFAFEGVGISDVFSDGQLWDGSDPILSFTEHGSTSTSAVMDSANFSFVKDLGGTGDTTATFQISSEMIARGFDGQLLGGCVPPGGTGLDPPDCSISDLGPTSGTIIFQTEIQDIYSDTFPSGDPSVDQGDVLDNEATISGNRLDVDTLTNPGPAVTDVNTVNVTIARGQVEKTIYAFTNQSGTTVCGLPPLPAACDPVQVSPGDEVTYRIRYWMPSSDVEGLSFVDYLPLPVFDATEVTTFDFTVDGSVPPAGTAKFGPTDEYYNWADSDPVPDPPDPSLSTNSTNNSVTFTYGTFDDPNNVSRWIDILFSVTVLPEPFADGLFLTNQVRQIEDSTFQSEDTADAIIQIQIQEPFLSVKKGTVASDASAVFAPLNVGPPSASFQPPGSTPSWTGSIESGELVNDPVDSDTSGVDAGDTMTFAVTIENLGSSPRGAFDIQVRDTIPAGFAIPSGGLNLRITRGNDPNTLINFTGLGGGLDGIPDTPDDFFDTGIELDDQSNDLGVCAGYSLGSGANIVIITYDLILDGTVVPEAVLINTATVQQYASEDGAGGTENFVGDESLYQDEASVTIASPALTKTYTQTEIDDTDNGALEAVIGEIVEDYTLVLTVPEGEMPGTIITDTLPSGLAFVDCTSISADPGLSTSIGVGDFSESCDTFINPAVASPGQSISFDLGDLDNDDLVNGTAETITIVYRVVVLNVSGNQNGTPLTNSAELTWNTTNTLPTVSAPVVMVIEPVLQVGKSVVVNGAGTSGDAGDPLLYTITVQHDGSSTADAYEVDLIDALPITGPGGPSLIDGAMLVSVTDTAGVLGATDFTLSGSDAAGYILSTNSTFDFSLTPPSGPTPRILTFVISGNLAISVQPGSFDNTATATWTSLDNDISTPKSIYNTNAIERTGSGLGPNDYTEDGVATVDIIATPGKTIVLTSEAFTGNDGSRERLAIGEIVRYRLSVDIPEGTSTAFQIRDQLPPGLLLQDTDQVMLSFTADADVTEAGDLSGADNDTIPPTFMLPAGRIATAFASNRQTVTFSLGNLINNDNDVGAETITLEFNALVDNSATGSNDAGDDRNNAFDVLVNSVVVSTSSTVDARISEPSITDLTKALFGSAPQDGGDVFTYRLTYSNANGVNNTSAFEVNLVDVLDLDLILVSVTVTAPGSFSDSSAGNTVDVTVDQLDPGASVTIDVQAQVVNDVEVGIDIPNVADLTYTSLPGTNGTTPNGTGSTTPGVSGSTTGERDGSGSGLNDYNGTTNLPLYLTDPAISKSIVATSIAATGTGEHDPTLEDLVIGEELTFEVVVTLPEGIADPLVITDDLPIVPAMALELISSQVISIGNNVSTTLLSAGSPGTVGDRNTDTIVDQVVFDFGDATNIPDGVSDAGDQIVLQIVARVSNISGNQNSDQIVNNVQVDYNAESFVASATADVVEPELLIAKLADDDTPAVGQTVTYTITVDHDTTSTADAHEIIITDVVPAGLTFLSGSSSLPPAQVNESGDPTIIYTIPALVQPGSASFTYQATVGTPPVVNVTDTLTNTAMMTWTSISGPDAYERSGTGGVNDYSANITEILTVTGVDLTLIKDDGVLSAVPGDTLPYTLTFDNIGNVDATGVSITETVPNYTVFDLANSTAGWSCADGAAPGNTCTITTPDIGSGVGVVPAGATASIDFAVRVDGTLPTGVDITSNTASIADDGNNGPEARLDNNSDTHDTPLIAAPDMTIVKDDGLTIVSPGSLLVYTLTYTNAGDQDAIGVEIIDVIPIDTIFNNASSSPGWSCDDPDAGGPLSPGDPGSTCTYIPDIGFGSGNIPAGNGGSVNLALIVDDPFPIGTTQVTNTASINDDGSNGPDATPGNNQSSDTDNVVTLGNVDLEKLLLTTNQTFTGGMDVAIGEFVTYRLRLTIPPGTMNSATLTDILDEGLAFNDCLSITTGPNISSTIGAFTNACSPNSVAPPLGNPAILPEPLASVDPEDQGRRIVFDLGDVSNNNGPGGAFESIIIEYQVVVLDNAGNARAGLLNNSVLWDWTAGDLTDTAPDVLIVEPTLTLDKSAAPRIAPLGTPITITLSVAHAGPSDTDAFDLILEDILPVELLFAGGLVNTAGLAPTTLTEAVGIITATWDDFPQGSTSTIEFQVTLDSLAPGQRVSNEARLEWTSLPDDGVSAPFALSPYNALATERRYDPNNLVDVYQVIATEVLGTPALPETGFAPDRTTTIPAQPVDERYTELDGLRLEIPALDLNAMILGVATDDQGWDLTWLWNRIGYLEGTAYPSWTGNTALTGHVVLSNGLPGPFARLNQLVWNDLIWLYANGLRYEYRVTYSWQTHPNDLSVFRHEDLDVLTLITCADYDDQRQEYRQRSIVRAILVRVDKTDPQP